MNNLLILVILSCILLLVGYVYKINHKHIVGALFEDDTVKYIDGKMRYPIPDGAMVDDFHTVYMNEQRYDIDLSSLPKGSKITKLDIILPNGLKIGSGDNNQYGYNDDIPAVNQIKAIIWADKNIHSLKLHPNVRITGRTSLQYLSFGVSTPRGIHVSPVHGIPYHGVTLIQTEDDILKILHHFEQLYPQV